MPAYVIVLSEDPGLYAAAVRALSADGRFEETEHGMSSADPVAHVYESASHAAEWDDWDSAASPGEMGDPAHMARLLIETGSGDLVAEVARLIAGSAQRAVWVVDAADHVWPAEAVDPERVALV